MSDESRGSDGVKDPTELTPLSRVGYKVIVNPIRLFDRLYWRASVAGRENVPTVGPAIIAPSHRSNIDSFLVTMVSTRHLHYMTKNNVWKHQNVGRLVEYFGSFPVDRDNVDRAALYSGLKVLDAGELLVVFPEGTRRFGPLVEDIHEGVAYLSLRADVPIVPVGIGGSARVQPKGSKILRPAKVHIEIGRPIYPPPADGPRKTSRARVNDLNARLLADLQRLFDTARVRAGA